LPVLLIAHFFHPLDRFSIERFLNGDVLHRVCRRSPVPVFFSGLEPDDIAGTDLFDRSAVALHQAQPKRHDQNLAEWMGVPGGTRSRFERHRIAGGARRLLDWEKWIDPHRAREPLGRSLCRRLRATSLDFHSLSLKIKAELVNLELLLSLNPTKHDYDRLFGNPERHKKAGEGKSFTRLPLAVIAARALF